MISRTVALVLVAISTSIQAARATSPDVVVYTATASGVIASVAAARHGAKVVLVEPGQHVGGMFSGGLGQSDVRGQEKLIGGLAREVYDRMARHYRKPKWQAAFNFEPHVAETVLRDMLREAGVQVFFGQRLASVRKEGARIISFKTESGNSYSAKVFIDAGYEGDLMARSGVQYAVGREGRAKYGEWLAGRTELIPSEHQFEFPVSPRKGEELLPFVTPQTKLAQVGDGDGKIQGYCFRLCLTDVGSNRIAITEPDGYDPNEYELLRRYFQSAGKRTIKALHLVPLPNGKYDANSSGPVSTILPGPNWEYPDASYERRQEIWQQHLRWAHGLLWFLQNDSSVPVAQRDKLRKFGLCKDEFTDTQGWPHQLYIREARRMLGKYVVTERDIESQRTKPDGVGMCGYNIDIREVQWVAARTFRYPRAEDETYTEGYVSQPVRPWQLPYGAFVPKAGECENLLTPVCASMSTVAYGSFRMEPGYMIAGHACGMAAAMAATANSPVQDVNCDKLRQLLRDQGQVIESQE
ncbi:MAG: FAD-dependent oxidoreductase [Pirellulales bacterium]|nr:FAD-dependent oxidoreductase [Pirellulales bacterium]